MTAARDRFVDELIIANTAAMIYYAGRISVIGTFGMREELGIEEGEEVRAKDLVISLVYASIVDNFNCYLSDVFTEILKKDPRPIFGKKLDVKDIFEYNNIDELKSNTIERFISNLGYRNIEDLADFFEKEFGISTMSHWLTKKRLNRVVQIRNIITHNRGLVNKIYLLRSKSKREVEGQRANIPHIIMTGRYLKQIVENLDAQITEKFLSECTKGI